MSIVNRPVLLWFAKGIRNALDVSMHVSETISPIKDKGKKQGSCHSKALR